MMLFEELNERENKDDLYTYFICALDSENVQFACNKIITNVIPNNFDKIE